MTSNLLNLKAEYHTLGCKLNFSETSAIGKLLSDRGVLPAANGEEPDIIVVNTCSVTRMADKKGRQLIHRLASRFPAATLVVTGCYAQLRPGQVAEIPGVDIVLGSNDKLRAADFIEKWLADRRQAVKVTPQNEMKEFIPSCERGDRTRYFLKVQDGCDYFCTYCTIPFARGRSRSGSIESIVEQARTAAAEGGREIVITGVNIGDFGHGSDRGFFDLIRELDKVEGIERYRISSIEPNLLTPEIIRWVATESRAFMPHFHIPLQAGSDRVLHLMNRRYDTSLFASRIETVREFIPDAFIGVDVIAGARGETETEWETGRRFIESLPITRLHVFPYSERPGTAALQLGDSVENRERHRRVDMLMEISDRKLHSFLEKHKGKEAKVLWEHPQHGGDRMHGFTDNYIRVSAPLVPELINRVSPVILRDIDPADEETFNADLIL